ncbi:MAG: aldehyde dehydrogenase [Armatimonadota bacterium]|nr:MAG: aldehyde dehydrogenase [Armatimonadota bacterium]
MQRFGLWLDGRWHETDRWIEVHSPYDGSLVGMVSAGDAQVVDQAVEAAQRAMEHPLPPYQRAEILTRAAHLIEQRREHFARTIALEAGKPIKTARIEVARAVSTLTFASIEARTLAGDIVPMSGAAAGAGKFAFTVREPIGVVGAITPFNFPLNLVCHKVAPAIAAGCAVVLKPASATPITALNLAEVFMEADLPRGWLNVIPGSGGEVGNALVEHPDIPLISFTGSAEVGWDIRARAPHKKVLLELGNSSPLIVFEDADMEAAAQAVATHGFSHAGQSCISVQRVLVHEPVAETFERMVTDKVAQLVVGDPLDEKTHVGPLITTADRDRVKAWIDEAVSAGARLLTGGKIEGTLLQPTVLADVTPEMKVFCKEVFGPVVGITRFRTLDEAVELANATEYGLQAGVFTASIHTAFEMAKRLHFGGVLINEAPTYRTDQMPYGGVKASGNTREGPHYAVREMTVEKLVVLNNVS